MNNIAIKVENLSKCYTLRTPTKDADGSMTTEHWALKDVSFEIKKGESVGIIGPNGSGKSTLLKILAGITKPTSGKVTINGRVASILDVGAGFHPELSGRENVFMNGQIHGFSKKEIAAKFDEIVEFSGIEKFIEEPVKNYSNGMYLRLAFSIMAHLDFDVYLLDEVLSVGDAEFQGKCIEKILEIIKSQKTFLIVYHNIHFADKLVTREIKLKSTNNNHQTINDIKMTEENYFDEKINLEGSTIERIKIPSYLINKSEKKGILVIKSSMNLSLATSQIIDFEKMNISKSGYFEITFSMKLTSGTYFLNLYDITNSKLVLLYSILLKVSINKNSFKHYGEQVNSVLLFESKIKLL